MNYPINLISDYLFYNLWVIINNIFHVYFNELYKSCNLIMKILLFSRQISIIINNRMNSQN